MPKSNKIAREDVLKGAAEVVRKRGVGALNARAVAGELGCSTQPVYSFFTSMDALKEALVEEAKARYHDFIEEYILRAGRSRYECFGMGFVKFAREERGLFRYLFMERAEEDPYLLEIVSEMTTLYHMSEEKARAFHTDMTVFSYGLAVLVNLGAFNPTDEEISSFLKREFYGLYAVHFPTRPRFWERETGDMQE